MKNPVRGKTNGGRVPLIAALVFLLSSFCLLPSAFCLSPSSRPPLYVSFLDQLPPQGPGPAFNGLDERRRGVLFQSVLQAAVDAGELPRVVVINHDLSLPSTRFDEPAVPTGATLVRVYLTQWADLPFGSFATSEVHCRVFAEVVRNGRTVSKLGPFLGRVPYTLDGMTTFDGRHLIFRDAARVAVDEMAHALPR